jgi:hypothetical protein
VPTVQSRSHLQASLHTTFSQASVPEQLIMHREPVSQRTSLHALPPTQLIVQVQPIGQTTVPQPNWLVQSTGQVFASSSHDVAHAAGHCRSTQ